MTDIIPKLTSLGCFVELVGSRATCNPPPFDTDSDFLVASLNGLDLDGLLVNEGYYFEHGDRYKLEDAKDFKSYRKDDINLIVSNNEDFIQKFRAATSVCKRLNLMNKSDRIALFQAVLYGKGCEI